MAGKKRIEYIDLMKGICIILVVVAHSGLTDGPTATGGQTGPLQIGRMPLYFFLSGLFFRKYSGFADFAIRKFSNLLIPMFVMGAFASIAVEIAFRIQPGGEISAPGHIHVFSYLTRHENIPLWFLRALFAGLLLLYGFYRLCAGNLRRMIPATLFLAVLSYTTCKFTHDFAAIQTSDLPFTEYVFTSAGKAVANGCGMSIFLWLGYLAGHTGLLRIDRTRRNMAYALAAMLAAVAILLTDRRPYSVYWAHNYIYPSWTWTVLTSCCVIISVWAVSFLLVRLPYVSYMGRYSIVVLCTHQAILDILSRNEALPQWAALAATLIAMPAVIYVCVRLLPWACAQKRVLDWRDGRLRLSGAMARKML